MLNQFQNVISERWVPCQYKPSLNKISQLNLAPIDIFMISTIVLCCCCCCFRICKLKASHRWIKPSDLEILDDSQKHFTTNEENSKTSDKENTIVSRENYLQSELIYDDSGLPSRFYAFCQSYKHCAVSSQFLYGKATSIAQFLSNFCMECMMPN